MLSGAQPNADVRPDAKMQSHRCVSGSLRDHGPMPICSHWPCVCVLTTPRKLMYFSGTQNLSICRLVLSQCRCPAWFWDTPRQMYIWFTEAMLRCSHTCVSSPVQLPDPRKLVYSPHVYGPDVHLQSYFTEPDFTSQHATYLDGAMGSHLLRPEVRAGCGSRWALAL